MKNIAIIGSMFGDEGKGHITHHFSKDFDWVIRFNGGANAGHTIYRDGIKYVHNLLPSFDWRHSYVKAFLGAGMVIDLVQLHAEIIKLNEIDPSISNRIFVDPDAFVVLESHKTEDKATNGHIGSTNRGIGPAYKDKIGRKGLRVKDLFKGSSGDVWTDKAFIKLKEFGVNFKYALELERDFKHDKLLFEGAQGIMLDINHGTYPYVSCSDATAGGIAASGFGFVKVDHVYGVAKVYSTKVGEGPFPTEIDGEAAEALRKAGNEYGATTGRPRRVGWIDLPALQYCAKKGGLDSLIITKFDILNGRDEVPMCASYGKIPVSGSDFFEARAFEFGSKVQFVKSPGWKNADNLDELKPFIALVASYTGLPVSYISKGIKPHDIVKW
jgi:adenylosuccinate synthase